MKRLDIFFRKTLVGLLSLVFLFTTAQVAITSYNSFTSTPQQPQPIEAPDHFLLNEQLTQESAPEQVLGDSDRAISFSGADNSISDGGVIVLNAKDRAQITVTNYNKPGNATFKLYKVSKDDLLNYLLYRKTSPEPYSSIEKIFSFDTSSISIDSSFEQEIKGTTTDRQWSGEPTPLSLPVDGSGIWYLEGELNGLRSETMIVRSNLAAIIHKGNNENIFWVQDTNYQNSADTTIELINTENSVTRLGEFTTDGDGIVKDAPNDALDVAVVSKNDEITIIPVNLYNLNYRLNAAGSMYSSFSRRQSTDRDFTFTDRFLYKPGDTVYFKSIIRTEDDVEFSIQPRTLQAIVGSEDDPIWQQTLQISELGTVDGAIPIPQDLEAGYYNITIKENEQYFTSAYFQVANFRKPDASVTVTTDKLMYLPGQEVTVSLKGTAFLGQPLRNQKVRYKIYQLKADISGDYSEMTYSQRNAYIGQNSYFKEGAVTLDKKGVAEFKLKAENTTGFRQFWVVHIEYLDGASVAANDMVQTLIQPGDFIIENDGTDSSFIVNQDSQYSLKLSKNKVDAEINNITVSAKLLKYINGSYTVIQEGLSATSDQAGKLSLPLKVPSDTSFRLELETHDINGNLIKGEESLYGSLTNTSSNNKNIFTITTDKAEYNVGDTARVNITTLPEIKNVFVSVGRSYSRKFQVLPVNNGVANFEFQVEEKFQPNIFIYVGSFYQDSWDSNTIDVSVNTSDKKVSVKITPSQSTYAPGETASFQIETVDGLGRPAASDVAFWIFDKALLELHGNYFEGVFEAFWSDRWFGIPTHYSYQGIVNSGAEGGGGCFAGETLITMSDGTFKRIDEVLVGDKILTYGSVTTQQLEPATVLGTHQVTSDGYLIVNGTLKVTPEHRLFVNNQWKTAGEISIGDSLLNQNGQEQKISSLEWVRGKFEVYNLHIEKFHTYFAGGVYVHNEKGEDRSVFKDTAYWNPHVTTGEDGKATVTVQMPDNLTTWVAAAVSANSKTQVGDGKTEFIVTKSIVARPIVPLFLRTGDELSLSALLYNFTKQEDSFSVIATMKGGDVNNSQQVTDIAAEDFNELFWPVAVTGSNQEGEVSISMKSQSNASLTDTITEKLPIYEYGSWVHNYTVGEDNTTLHSGLSSNAEKSRTTANLTLKPSQFPELAQLLNSLIDSRNWYDATDAASALIAASIISEHGAELGIPSANLQTTATAATNKLKETRNGNGIWTRGADYSFDPAKTRLVIESLVKAQSVGLSIDEDMLNTAVAYFANWKPILIQDKVEQQYVFSLLSGAQFPREKLQLAENLDPETIARAAIANKKQGFANSNVEESAIYNLARIMEHQVGWSGRRNDERSKEYSIFSPTVWSVYALQSLESSAVDVGVALEYVFRNNVYESEIKAIQALTTVTYYLNTQQLSPNYQYVVKAGSQTVASGTVNSAQQDIAPIFIPADVIQSGQAITIEKSGNGKLFSQLDVNQFYPARNLEAQQHNLTLTRKYLGTKPAGEPVMPGDLVIVEFTVGGLGLGETSVQIEDYLPSNLMAIDESLDNGNFDAGPNDAIENKPSSQITDQGMKLTFQNLTTDGKYSYKTRVVSQGSFDTPPAVVKLVKQPALWAASDSYKFIVDGKVSLDTVGSGGYATNKPSLIQNKPILAIVAGTVIAVASILAIIFRNKLRNVLLRFRHGTPPDSPPPPQPPIV